MKTRQSELLSIYSVLLNHFGYRNWWPADTPTEMMIGAILTQNVAWKNAKTAIDALKQNGLIDPFKLIETDAGDIAPLIKSSRFYNQKSIKIKTFVDFYIKEYNGDIRAMSEEQQNILNEL